MKKKRLQRYFAFFMALNLIFEVVSPTVSYALTSGPIQPEFVGFEPANSSEMVDLFTGDFKYNIPLMDVDGYPLNLSYHAGANMESEASWVGLGWSMNPGVLNRMVKGLPDDFNGDEMKTETRMKPHVSMGLGFQKSRWFGADVSYEIVGAGAQIGVNAAVVLTYNNYKGFGIETQLDGNASLSANVGPYSGSVAGGVGMALNSQDGGTLSYQHSKGFGTGLYSASIGEGTSINTRSGAMTKTYFGTQSIGFGGISISKTTSHTLPSGSVAYSPKIANDYTSFGFGLSAKFGLWGCVGLNPPPPPVTLQLKGGTLIGFKGFYNKSEIVNANKTSKSYGYLYLENADEKDLMDFNRFKDGAISEEVPNGPVANKTYDNFSATAQGFGSNFRAFRSDIGIVHDPYTKSSGFNLPVSTELSGLLILHSLADVMLILNDGYSGNWNSIINNSIKFQNKDVTVAANRFYEKTYFKQFGEISSRNSAFDNGIGNESAVAPSLKKIDEGYEAIASGGLNAASRNKRDIRNVNIGNLTAAQANEYGFEKTMKFYDINNSGHSVNASTRMVNTTGSPVSRLTKSVPGNPTYPVTNHISEISMTNTSGSRYVYGIPAYNLYKKRVMFNASDRTESAYQANGYPTTNYTQNPLKRSNTHQIVEYNPSTDLANNKRGTDNLYTADETPAYANSYLLTSILSTDYMDVTQDGPSYDDLGSFTKFNYSKVSDFTWREPFGVSGWATDGTSTSGTRGNLSNGVSNQANFDKGLVADDLDDKGFYEYGTRENYYLQSIETKNYVAFFECSLRDDYKGVTNEHGAAASANTYKLDKIKLYSKSELLRATLSSPALPIKVVNFEYTYDLCPKSFNSGAPLTYGKLTLKKVYFTYGNSQKAALSPYEFFYGDNDHNGNTDNHGNPEYNNKAMDRWGTYKPNSTNSGIPGDETPDIGILTKLNNIEFPYSEQDEDLANQYVVAWNLTKIITPSNAVIEVTYEADDYGYVQNELAGQMLMIKNTQSSINANADASAFGANDNLFDGNCLVIDLEKLNTGIPTSIPLAQANSLVQKNMFRPESDMYYKCFMKLGGPANSFGLTKTYYDYVPGYATIKESGLYNSSSSGNTYTKNSITYYKYAYVRLKKEIAYGSTEVSPISLAGWEFMRSFLPRIAYPGSEPANMGDDSHKPAKQFANALVGLGVALADFVAGVSNNPNFRFHYRNFCKEMDYSKSFVRALVPLKKKKGGGHRVKQLLTKDNWNTMTTNTGSGYTELGSMYGQSFNYTTKDVNNATEISSGVAYYEPLQGGDEISLRKPIKFDIEKKMAPNDHLFQEEPYCEMLYPAPQVGYSKVTVTPISENIANLYKIGKSVFEFYTAKDYPIIESRTALKKELFQNQLIENFTVVEQAYKILHVTQGHVIKLNDMHGKLKCINTYGEDNLQVPISGASYTYKDAAYKNNSRQLVTSAKTLSEANVIATEQIARDIDVTLDNRASINEAITTGNSVFLEISLCSPPVVANESLINGYVKTGLRSSIATKIVQQYGILEKSEVFDDKSRTLSENLLWEKNTGQVILSKTTNNLDQPVYTYNYPASWAHPKMGHEFERENVIIKVPVGNTIWNRTTGTLPKAAPLVNPEVLAVGDEVVVFQAGSPIINNKRYWVTYDVSSLSTVLGYTNTSDYNYCLVDAEGIILNTSTTPALSLVDEHYIKVVRPADRNQVYESAGSVSSLAIPSINAGSGFNITNTEKVVSANMQTWCSGWNGFLKESLSQQQSNCLHPSFSQTVLASEIRRFNPYTAGVLGNWRPYTSYAYNVNRSYDGLQANVKADGVYSSYSPFWQYVTGSNPYWNANSTGWVSTKRNTVYSPYGYPMESKDALNIYQAQRYGFNHTLPILSASNARVREVGFESFEDYYLYYPAINSCNIIGNDQLDFYNQINLVNNTTPQVTINTAHTGRTSLSFLPAQGVTLTHYINREAVPYYSQSTRTWKDYVDYCADDIALNKLNLPAGKYVVSFWVKSSTPAISYASNFTFGVETKNGTGVFTAVTTAVKQSPVINGWQKFDYQFDIGTFPSFALNSLVRFKINAVNAIYMDDFRIQPFNSTMTCTVYDPYQMRVWAQLDDNNYATIMEYDNEGTLVRKKKETLKGLYTIQETRQATVKRN